jgi:hypothetical protein
MKKLTSLLAAGALLAAFAINSSAASIPGLQDTGVGTAYNSDPVWQITLDPSGGSVPRPATIINALTGTSPFNWYSGAPVGAGANWIGPNSSADHNPGVPDGTYEYELQFNLTGYNPATASFVYESAADNFVLGATLNGAGIPYDTRVPGGGNQYHTLSGPLAVTGPFVSGINTLIFDVSNTTPNPSPTGFLFIVDSSVITAVPEPASLGLLLIGGAALLLRRRR